MRTANLLQKTEAPEGKSGYHRIERFEVSHEEAERHHMQCIFSGAGNRGITPGSYTRLVRGPFDAAASTFACTVVMSDTPAEMRDHFTPVSEAKGHCLVHGLGLGIVAEAMLRKDCVDHVTVIEKSEDVVTLVAPYLRGKWGDKRITIVQADAMTWKPPKGARYGCVWHDIWDSICADNLPDMRFLHRRFGQKADWQGSWARELI